MRTQHIIPAIIPDSIDQLERTLRDLRSVAHRIQVDVMDGTYAPGKTWPYDGVEREAFEAIRREDDGLPYWQDFDFEIDLLVKNPEERIEEWAIAGAACLIVHTETTDKLAAIVADCKNRRLELALALTPSTDIAVLAPYVSDLVFVQVMGNDRVGRHGVPLDPRAVEHIRAIKKEWPDVVIGVDIGVKEETLPQLLEAGATRFAAGSAIFEMGEPARAWKYLEAIASKS